MIQRLFKEMFVLAIGVVAVFYLINPTAGFLEFIPDNLPLIGNLDEAGATVLLVSVLGYYGIDVTNFLPERRKKVVRRIPGRTVKTSREQTQPTEDQ